MADLSFRKPTNFKPSGFSIGGDPTTEFDEAVEEGVTHPLTPTFKCVVLGDTAVGKTSLTKRYFRGDFDESARITIGSDIHSKRIGTGDERHPVILLKTWDTGGGEQHQTLTRAYLRDVDIIILTYDLTRPSTTRPLEHWLRMYLSNSDIRQEQRLTMFGGQQTSLDLQRATTRGNLSLTADETKTVRQSGKERLSTVRTSDANQLKLVVVVVGTKLDAISEENYMDRGKAEETWAYRHGWMHFTTSAKSGKAVDCVFNHVTRECIRVFPERLIVSPPDTLYVSSTKPKPSLLKPQMKPSTKGNAQPENSLCPCVIV